MKCFVCSALLSAPLVFSFNVKAEETDDHRLDTVSVTALHRDSDVTEIAGSVDLLSGDEADFASTLNGVEDVTRLLTGVQVAVANGSQPVFQIRGIGAVDHQALTPGAAAIYQNGVFLATNVQTGQMLYDLDRVEVLKGPQGTMYGRNASSGAIHFLSRVAGTEAVDYVQADFGRFDRRDISFGFDVDLNEHWTSRFAGRALFQDATLKNVPTGQIVGEYPEDAGGKKEELGLRFSLLNDAVAGGELLIIGHLELDRGINPTPRNDSLDIGDHEISSEGEGLQPTDNEFFGLSAKWQGEFGDWSLSALTAVEGYNQQYGFDFDGTPAPSGVTTLNANLSYDRDYLQFSEDLIAQKSFDWGHGLFGIHASADRFEQSYLIWCGKLDADLLIGTCPYVGTPGRVGPVPASDGTPMSLLTEIDQDRVTVAGFNHNEIELTEALTLIAGGRVTFERLDGQGTGQHIFDDGTIAFNNRDGAGLAIGQNVLEDTRFSGNLGLTYRIDGFGVAYASVANGFKSGGFNGEVQNNATHWSDEGLFDAETVTAYELGFKSLTNNRFDWTLAAFFQDYEAPQARIFVSFELPDGSTIVSNSLSNLDEAQVLGLEADAYWVPWPGMSVRGGLTLLDSEIHQQDDLGGNAALFDGNPLPFASDVSARLGLAQTWTLPSGSELLASVSAKHNGAFYLDAEGRDDRRQKSYTLLDADLSLRLPSSGWRFSVWGRNLLDEDYAVSGYGFIGYNTFRSDPATYGIRLRYEFASP